jgi:hypothetical protein
MRTNWKLETLCLKHLVIPSESNESHLLLAPKISKFSHKYKKRQYF